MSDTADSSAARRRIALAALLVGTFMGVVDVFVVVVALPAIRADLGASFGQSQLILAGYAMAYAVGLITGGRLGDLYGRRRVFLIGTAAFIAASVVCGIAGSAGVLITARIVEGLAAAAMLPQVLSLIRTSFTGHELRVAVGWYGATVGLGAVSGPVVGGILLGANWAGLGWRWVFLINVPLGLAALAGAALTVDESRHHGPTRLDLPGVGLASAGCAALLLPLTLGVESGWPAWMVALLALAPALLGGFVAYEHRVDRSGRVALMPPRLFTNRVFAAGIGIVLIMYAGDGLFFVLTHYLQEGYGVSPARAGALLAPVGLGFAIGSATAPRIMKRGGLLVPTAGVVLVIAGFAGVVLVDRTVASASQSLWFIPVLFGLGAGNGWVVNPCIGLVVSKVAPPEAGAASAVLLTTTQVANALGVALAGSVFFALLTRAASPAPAAFSRALAGSVLLLCVLTVGALPLLRPLHRED